MKTFICHAKKYREHSIDNWLGFIEFKKFKQKKNAWSYLFFLEYYFDNFAKYGLKDRSEARNPGEKQCNRPLAVTSSNHRSGRNSDNGYSECK